MINSRYSLVFLLLLSSCAVGPQGGYLPPVVDNSSQAERGLPGTAGGDGVQTYPLPDGYGGDVVPLPVDTPPASTTQPTSNAVVALLERADQQTRAGESDAAAASLERALRIEPRNAGLWSRLATIRLEQGQPEQAEQLALKSNSLSPHDAGLQARNWDTVARARWARNDGTGARAAEAKADELRRR